jgi:HTH-type transcriptional regulator/antitoxin HigA
MKQKMIDAYGDFIKIAWPYLHIANEEDYREALDLLENLFESSADSEDDPMNPLVDLLASAVERYELTDDGTRLFLEEADKMPKDAALLHTLMDQYYLTVNDFPEIGSKSMVTKVLHGKRILTKEAIERIIARFGLNPGLFRTIR